MSIGERFVGVDATCRSGRPSSVKLSKALVAALGGFFLLVTSPVNANSTIGEWGPVIPWPHIAVSMANLPDGRILTWSGSERTTWPTTEQTYSATWNPGTSEFIEIFHDSHNMFCAHLAMTEDGKVFVNGGRNQTNSPWTSLFDYENDQWIQVQNMATGGRWYPTTLALADGSIMTSMGTAANFRNPEKWSASDGWSVLNGVDFNDMRQTRSGTNGGNRWWPILSVAPSGDVFHFWDSDASYVIATDGVGRYQNANAITDDPAHAPGVFISYDVGKMLVTGSNQGSWDGPSASAFVIDLNGPSPQITATDPMNFARRFHHLVPLPTGEVLVVGGNTGDSFTDNGSVMESEIWNPITGQWRVTAPLDIPRNYHSTALLLTDGRVLAAGGGYQSNKQIPANHRDGQVYSPPYLFAADGSEALRPDITSAPGIVRAGETFSLSATPGLADFTMIKMSATTHAVNTDVRFSRVAFTEDSPGSYTLTPHANENVLIPGYWMLFALNGEGVPSVAHVARVERVVASPPSPSPGPYRYVKLMAYGEWANQPWTSVAELGVLDVNGRAIPRGAWVASADSHEPDAPPAFAIDGDTSTIWHTEWRVQNPPHPHELVADLGQGYDLGGFTYLPPQQAQDGRISDYELYVSADGILWGSPVASGTFPDTIAQQQVNLVASVPLANVDLADSPAAAANTDVVFSATAAPNLQYRWSFGDGTPETELDTQPSISHRFEAPGRYNVVATIRDAVSSEQKSIAAIQIVYDARVDPGSDVLRRLSSSSVVFHPTNDEVWNVNPDNDSATVIDASEPVKIAEIAVGNDPRALAIAPDGRVWVANKGSSTISVVDPTTRAVVRTTVVGGGRNVAPHGIVFDPAGTAAFVALENVGEVKKLGASTLAELGTASVGARPRHLAIAVDGSKLYVSRFITPKVPGEDGASPDVTEAGGEVVVLSADDLSVVNTIIVRHSDDLATENTGPGLPNYLGPLALSPAGDVAYLPSKQDNVLSGARRSGANLTFDQTVRAISSKIDLVSERERTDERIDHDNASVASHAVFDPYGIHLFTALEGNRQIAVSDALIDSEILRFDVGRAPQGLALSADGMTLAVHNFLDRTVELVNVSRAVKFGEATVASIATVATVERESLDRTVLLGKQLFYDARDDRLAALDYMSCASCHNAGGEDGRTWDFTQFGEGLRNTISLNGHGVGHGPLHWTANFDEVQDFEGQIRGFAQGLGLMSDADFFFGTRQLPHGDPKAGLSVDLDALAAYVESLSEVEASPYREANGSLTASGLAGRGVFARERCASCHAGAVFTDSAAGLTHDVGTLKPESGPQTALDTPSLLGAWNTAPYLHDGSAATLRNAVFAHTSLGLPLSEPDLDALASYLAQLDAAAALQVVDVVVARSSDDAEESSGISLASGDLDLSEQIVGVRFNGVAVPRGSVVTDAYVEFTAHRSRSSSASMAIRGAASDNAPTFKKTSANISSRRVTTAAVAWSPKTWTVDQKQRTPALTAIVQEIVNRSGWASDNSLVIIFKKGSGKREARTYDDNPSKTARLHIEFLGGGGAP